LNFSGIKNLIFDLGGVIINLDMKRTFSAFAVATGKSVSELQTMFFNQEIWQSHETGKLSDQELRQHLRTNYIGNLSDEEIDSIWNALLLDIPLERIQLLQHLKTKYRLIMLSNTNGIHEKHFTKILANTSGISNFDALFDKVYYSHKIGMRKPDFQIFNHVLAEQNIQTSETVFIDDNLDNIEAAKSLGIHTLHVVHPTNINQLLANA